MNFLENWKEERRSAFLYRVLVEAERGSPREDLFLKLAEEAEQQALLWKEKIVRVGGAVPESFRPELRARIVAFLVRKIGPRSLKTVLAAMKVRGMSVYASPAASEHPMPMSVQEVGGRHRGVGGGGALRAAVFGASDGLVSNASLILGVAGASSEPKAIVLAGIAGLLAGAFSMAAGEFVSVRSQREMYEYQIGLEREELNEYPQAEAEELALIYKAKGLTGKEAKQLADKLIADPNKALDTLAREELGLNPDDLGSPWGAALFSFLSFAVGAAVPLVPVLVLRGPVDLTATIISTGVALLAIGVTLSLFTGRSALWSGLRMLLIGGAAGTVTYLVGRLLGVSLS